MRHEIPAGLRIAIQHAEAVESSIRYHTRLDEAGDAVVVVAQAQYDRGEILDTYRVPLDYDMAAAVEEERQKFQDDTAWILKHEPDLAVKNALYRFRLS